MKFYYGVIYLCVTRFKLGHTINSTVLEYSSMSAIEKNQFILMVESEQKELYWSEWNFIACVKLSLTFTVEHIAYIQHLHLFEAPFFIYLSIYMWPYIFLSHRKLFFNTSTFILRVGTIYIPEVKNKASIIFFTVMSADKNRL